MLFLNCKRGVCALLLGGFLLGCKSEYREAEPVSQPAHPIAENSKTSLLTTKSMLNHLAAFRPEFSKINLFLTTHRALHSMDEDATFVSPVELLLSLDFRMAFQKVRITQDASGSSSAEMDLSLHTLPTSAWNEKCSSSELKLVLSLSANSGRLMMRSCGEPDFLDLIQFTKISNDNLQFQIVLESLRRLFPEQWNFSEQSTCEMTQDSELGHVLECSNLGYFSKSGVRAHLKALKLNGLKIKEFESETEISYQDTKVHIGMKTLAQQNISIYPISSSQGQERIFSFQELSEKWFNFHKKVDIRDTNSFAGNDLQLIREFNRSLVLKTKLSKEAER